ncbi:MAG: YhbY family RNA-binding protein [Sphaerochaetaceae bacterium]|nr:YhbY family RNA-binding protein [Sphaerochaetaceae bacterium]
MPDKKVTSKFRAQLRSQAQTINPVVMVGHEGISEGVLEALDQALTCHELVKVRFQDFKDLTKDLANELADKTKSLLVSVTGFTAVFYRENPTKLNKK